MALIGTISGSNNTTTSAVTGSMIIAADPSVITPIKPTGVVLYVSGSATSIGADSPSILLKGDSFISGAFGTDSYIQMKPVNLLRVPTNTTASYIYTSGSTNDLYFTQYNGAYTNTTRLRWLEGSLGTGLLAGGALSSVSGSTTYNIASGSGLIVNYNAHNEVGGPTEPYPVITRVEWSNLNNQPLPSLSTTQITYVGMDSTGTPYLKSTPFIDGDFDSYISLGRILHTDKVGTNGAVVQPTVSYGQTHFRGDFVRSFGPVKLSGHTFYASGSQGLKKDAGDSYAEGRNYAADPDSPNYVKSTTDTAQLTSKIFYEYVDAAGDDVINNNGNVGYSVLDCNRYNNAGSLATVGSGNKFTIQRVFWFPNAVNRAFYVYYGNAIYSTIADAQAGIATEVFTEGKNTRDGAIFLGYVIMQGVTLDFADPTTYKIIQAGSFRAVASSGAGATGTPGGSDTYVQFNDATVFNGTNDFRFVKGTGTAFVSNMVVTGTADGSLVSSGTLQLKDSGGKVVGSISNLGVISGSSNLQIGGSITGSNMLLSSGFIVTGSGIIESNTSTSALRVTQQGSGNAITVEDSANPDASPFVVAADGKVGVGTTAPTANFFTSGTDPLIPVFVAKGHDVTVNTLSVTSSAGASTAIGFVNIDQGNYSNKYGLAITNIGTGKSGLKLAANTTGGSFAIDNMNATPTIYMTQKNLWFESVSTAFDTSKVTYKFIENNKAVTYSDQKTFLISGNTNGYKTGSYFEVEKSGSIKLLELQGDTTNNSLFVSGSLLVTGSVFTAGDLAVSGGNITTSATTFNLVNTTATTVNFAQAANTISIGKIGGVVTISSTLTASSAAFFADPVTIGGASQADLLTTRTTANIFNTVATTLNIGGAATTINHGGSTTTGSFAGDISVSGRSVVGTTVERLSTTNGGTGTVSFDTVSQGIFYVKGPTGDITANFTNVPTTDNRVLTPTVVLSQSATARIVSAVQINSSVTTLNWANGVIPTGNASKHDVFGFSLIRSGSTWTVLGQMSTYG